MSSVPIALGIESQVVRARRYDPLVLVANRAELVLHQRSSFDKLLKECLKLAEELVAHLVLLEGVHVLGILSAREKTRKARFDK